MQKKGTSKMLIPFLYAEVVDLLFIFFLFIEFAGRAMKLKSMLQYWGVFSAAYATKRIAALQAFVRIACGNLF